MRPKRYRMLFFGVTVTAAPQSRDPGNNAPGNDTVTELQEYDFSDSLGVEAARTGHPGGQTLIWRLSALDGGSGEIRLGAIGRIR